MGAKSFAGIQGHLAKHLLLAHARAEQPDIGERLVGQRAQPVAVVREGMRLHHREVAPRDGQRQTGDAVRGAAQAEMERRRKALGGEVGGAVVHHRDLESVLPREAGERHRVVPGAEDEEARRRPQHVDERIAHALRPGIALEQRSGAARQGKIRFRRPAGAAQDTPGQHQGAPLAGARQQRDGRVGNAGARQLVHLLSGAFHEGGVDALDVDVHGPFAPEPEAPERLLVAAGVVVQETVRRAADDLQRLRADVRLQASAAHAPARVAARFDEELGARTPVGRAGDLHHRRHRCGASLCGQLREPIEDQCSLHPMLHETGPPATVESHSTSTIVRFQSAVVDSAV